MPDVRDMRAALDRGSRIVVVTPPAPEQLSCWELLGPGTVIVCADQTAALDWVAAAPAGRSVHAVTALPRAARLLQSGAVDVLAGSLTDLAALVASSHLKLDRVTTLVLAWPEGLTAGDASAALDSLLGEAGSAQRVILTWNPAALASFFERQAPRAPQFGQPALDADGRPAPPVCPARYLVSSPDRRLTALRQVLDTLDPSTVAVWTSDERHAARLRDVLGLPAAVVTAPPAQPVSLLVCARVPTREQLAPLAASGPVVLLAAPYQLPYLRTLARLTPLGAASAAQGAKDRGAQLRHRIAARLSRSDVDAELEQLAPLFDRYDPAEVAAALLALRREETPADPAPVTVPAPSWVKVWVSVGKKDRAAAKDLVGALTRELGVLKEDIGKVEVRDAFSLVEIAGPKADGVMKGLSKVAIRGRRLTARLDRAR